MRFEVSFALQGLGQLDSGQLDSGRFDSGQLASGHFDSGQFDSGRFEGGYETPRYLRTEALRFDTELESKDAARHVLSTCGGSGAVRLMKDLLSFDGTLHFVDR